MKKLNKEDIKDIIKVATSLSMDSTDDYGKSFFEAISKLYPDIANEIKNTEYDTSININNIEICINYLID